LLVIAILQAGRAVLGLDVMVDGHHVPVMASWIASGVALFLSLMLFAEARR
jgi:hypothetical protein